MASAPAAVAHHPPPTLLQRLEWLEQRVGIAGFWTGAHLLFFSVIFHFSGSTKLHAHGTLYFQRSLDFFMQSEETRQLFQTNVGLENVLVPFIAHVVRLMAEGLGFEYTTTWYFYVALVPYLLFIVGMSIRFRKELGFVGTAALSLALYSSGLLPYMLTWGGYVDGMAYLLLLLVFLAVDRSLPLTLLLVVAATLNHYQGLIAIMIMMAAMFLIRRDRRYLVVIAGALAAFTVSNLAWRYGFGSPSLMRVSESMAKFESFRTLSQQIAEVYGPSPWGLLSPFKLMTAPLLYLGVMLLRKDRLAGLGYLLPMLAGAGSLIVWEDVTRHVATLAMPSFLLLVAVVAGSRDLRVPARIQSLLGEAVVVRVLSLFVVCGFLSVLTQNYYVNNGQIWLLETTKIEEFFTWLGDMGCTYIRPCQ